MPVRKEATVLLTENIDSRVSPESAQVPQDAPVTFPPRSGQPHRGLYIGLGALIVLFSTPPGHKCRNSRYGTQRDGSRTISTSTDCSASPWSSQERPRRAREFGHGQKPCEHRKPSFAVGGHQQDESGAVVPPAPSEADQLAELDAQADQLSGRETAISASLDTLQRQQNAHGLHLRGDIIAAQSRMRTYSLKRKRRFRLKTFEMPANIWNWQNLKPRRSRSFWGAKQARQSE